MSENSKIFTKRGEVKIRFGGAGGQGAVLAATLIGEAAVTSSLHAAGSSSYGSQARGGAAVSDIIVSSRTIDYPHISRPDILVALWQDAYDESSSRMAAKSIILADTFFVKLADLAGITQYSVPATEMILEKLESKQGANVLMIGVIVELTGLVDDGAIFNAIESNLNARFHESSKRAYRMGREFAKTMKKHGSG